MLYPNPNEVMRRRDSDSPGALRSARPGFREMAQARIDRSVGKTFRSFLLPNL